MDRRAVYLRTSKGLKELMGRTSLLGSSDRNILFLVTGKVTLGEIEARLDPSLKSRLQASIDKLVREEFIFVPGPSEMGSETDITNGVLIDPTRASRPGAVQSAAGRSAADVEPALTATSDDAINAALKQAQDQSRRQSIVERLHQVEHMASSSSVAVTARKAVALADGALVASSIPGGAAAGVKFGSAQVFARTAKGAQEYIGRTQTLPPTLAKLLALIDGESNLGAITARVGDGDGRVVGLGIQKLVRDGYVQEATLAIKDLVPAADFEQTLERTVGAGRIPVQIEGIEPPAPPATSNEPASDKDGAFGDVAQALANHAAIEASVAETARQVIARAAAPSTAEAEVAAKLPTEGGRDLDEPGRAGRAQSRRRSRRVDVEQDAVEEIPAFTHSVDPERTAPESKSRRFRLPRWAIAVAALSVVIGGGAFWLWPLFDSNHYAQTATRYLGRPVAIGALGVELTPMPAIRLSDVRIGGGGSTIRVGKVSINLVPATLFDPGRSLHDVRVHDIVVTSDELRATLAAAATDPGALSLRKVDAHGVKIIDRHWTLDRLSVQALVGPRGALTQLVVTGVQGDTRVVFTPSTSGAQLEITSSKLQPFGADFELHDFSARGTYSSEEVVLTEFDGRVLQGVVKGQARIRSGATWTAEGVVEGRGMELSALAKSLMRDGQFNAKARFSTSAPTPAKLFASGTLEGSLAADHGTLVGVDLSRVAQGEANPRGNTPFTELVASFRADAGLRQVASNVRFRSNKVGGAASIHVDAKQTLTGQLTGELATPSGPLRGSVNLSGSPARLVLGK